MTLNALDFSAKFVEAAPALREAVSDLFLYWEPDSPPVTSLYGVIGKDVAAKFDGFSHFEKEKIFALIEEALRGDDEMLGNAVATGLLEALVIRVGEDLGLWSRIDIYLGAEAREYVDAWNAWCFRTPS